MNAFIIFFLTFAFILSLFSGLNFVIVAVGVIVALHAMESDVSYSDDHPLVKRQGLPL